MAEIVAANEKKHKSMLQYLLQLEPVEQDWTGPVLKSTCNKKNRLKNNLRNSYAVKVEIFSSLLDPKTNGKTVSSVSQSPSVTMSVTAWGFLFDGLISKARNEFFPEAGETNETADADDELTNEPLTCAVTYSSVTSAEPSPARSSQVHQHMTLNTNTILAHY